jgi:hypothetical protein
MDSIHDVREQAKLGLESYLYDYQFPDLEVTLKDAITDLYSQFALAEKAYETYFNNKNSDEIDDFEIFCLEDNIFSIQERLYSIYEMIIINDYKEVEIKLKTLLKATLGIDDKILSSFDNIKKWLKTKGIILYEISNFNEINDLRRLNNHLKHSGSDLIPKDLKNIEEFKVDKKIMFNHLINFHNRTKDLRINFILDLRDKIYSHLYEFDESKINNMAERIVKRMNESQVNHLLKRLNELM